MSLRRIEVYDPDCTDAGEGVEEVSNGTLTVPVPRDAESAKTVLNWIHRRSLINENRHSSAPLYEALRIYFVRQRVREIERRRI